MRIHINPDIPIQSVILPFFISGHVDIVQNMKCWARISRTSQVPDKVRVEGGLLE